MVYQHGNQHGLCYDRAGNLIFDNQLGAGGERTYDAENRIVSAGGGGLNKYVHDADGRRVRRLIGAQQFWQVYGIDGELLAEYLPFGEENLAGSVRSAANGYGADSVRQRFTGYERDSETGLDFAQARYYANAQGRFTSVDPLMASALAVNPQSWNRYTYVLNNPLVFIDPTGLLWIASGNANNPYRWIDECPEGGTCYEAVAAPVATGLWVYGSRDANDITPYNSNENGVVNAIDIANHRDARYESVANNQPNPENFLSPTVAAALFNAAIVYAAAYPNDAEIVFTAGSAATGNPAVDAQGRPVHESHQGGRNIDMRYMGANGRSLVGNTASANADVERMTTLFDAFDRQNAGLGSALTGTPARFGLGPIDADLARIHRNHVHFQRNYPRPPRPGQPARRR